MYTVEQFSKEIQKLPKSFDKGEYSTDSLPSHPSREAISIMYETVESIRHDLLNPFFIMPFTTYVRSPKLYSTFHLEFLSKNIKNIERVASALGPFATVWDCAFQKQVGSETTMALVISQEGMLEKPNIKINMRNGKVIPKNTYILPIHRPGTQEFCSWDEVIYDLAKRVGSHDWDLKREIMLRM